MARKILAILILLMLAATYAHAIGVGGEGLRFGRVGATAGKAIPPVAQPTGKILLVDAASFILQVDAASKVCRAGGC